MEIISLVKEQSQFNKDSAGIYMIFCPNNTCYIGQSKNVYRRWREHKWMLKNNKHENSHLQNIYNKYGIPLFFILENCIPECLNEREIAWGNQIVDRDKLINQRGMGEVVQVSEETRRKIGAKSKGRSPSEATRKRLKETSKAAYEANKAKRFEQAQMQAKMNIENNTKIKPEQYPEIFKLLSEGKTQKEIATMLGVSRATIGLVKNRQRKELR